MSTFVNSAPEPKESEAPFTVDGETHKTWYKVYGDLASGSVPLVVLHGGKVY